MASRKRVPERQETRRSRGAISTTNVSYFISLSLRMLPSSWKLFTRKWIGQDVPLNMTVN